MKVDAIVTMANLIHCRYYRQIDHLSLINDILTICRFALMMEDIQGFILFNNNTNQFYFRQYEHKQFTNESN